MFGEERRELRQKNVIGLCKNIYKIIPRTELGYVIGFIPAERTYKDFWKLFRRKRFIFPEVCFEQGLFFGKIFIGCANGERCNMA